MVYRWKSGSHIKADPAIAAAQMDKLEKEGNLTAKGLLDANRPEDAPLHNEFEWRDTVAAELYREHQARHLINSIVVIREDVGPVRSYFKITKADSHYQSLNVILEKQDSRDALLRVAYRELRAFQEKYKTLSELKTVFDAINKLDF